MTVVFNPRTGEYKHLNNFNVKGGKHHHKRVRDKLSKKALQIKKLIDEESKKILQNEKVNKLLDKVLNNSHSKKNNAEKEDVIKLKDINKGKVTDPNDNKIMEEAKDVSIKEAAVNSEVDSSLKANLRGVNQESTSTQEDHSSFSFMDMIGKVDQYIGEYFSGDLH